MFVMIFANGHISEFDWLESYISQAIAIVAADGGVRHALEAGHQPDVVIGDMDSITEKERERLDLTKVRLITHSPDKDQTDLELALEYTINNYDEDIMILGALGGRLDQTMGNILTLANDGWSGRHIEIVEPDQRAWIIHGKAQIRGEVGDLVSLIPLDGDVHILKTAGLKWPLHDEKLVFGASRGISNVLLAEVAELFLKSGRLLCIHLAVDKEIDA